jgi:hypothetical protein
MYKLNQVLSNYSVNQSTIDKIIRYRKLTRRLTALYGIEYAIMLNIDTGSRVGEIIEGGRHEADVNQHLLLLNKQSRYLQMHSHPRSSTISLDDLILVLAYNEIKAMVVVGANRWTYLLIKVEDAPNHGYINTLIQQEFQTLRPKYKKMLAKGRLSENRISDMMLHEVMVKVTPSLGLRYFKLRE